MNIALETSEKYKNAEKKDTNMMTKCIYLDGFSLNLSRIKPTLLDSDTSDDLIRTLYQNLKKPNIFI
jgi:hypothetical protein